MLLLLLLRLNIFLLLKVCFMLVACVKRLSEKIKMLTLFFISKIHNTSNSVF